MALGKVLDRLFNPKTLVKNLLNGNNITDPLGTLLTGDSLILPTRNRAMERLRADEALAQHQPTIEAVGRCRGDLC